MTDDERRMVEAAIPGATEWLLRQMRGNPAWRRLRVNGPSDWEKGALAAAAWLKREGKLPPLEVAKMLAGIVPDTDGTEARTVKQIATYIRDGHHELYDSVFAAKDLADAIERGDWRPK